MLPTQMVCSFHCISCALKKKKKTFIIWKKDRSCSTISGALVLQTATEPWARHEFHHITATTDSASLSPSEGTPEISHPLPSIFPQRFNCVHPGLLMPCLESLYWGDIVTNSRGCTVLYAPKKKKRTSYRKEEGSKGRKPGTGLSHPLFAFWHLGMEPSKGERGTTQFPVPESQLFP